jgi:asparagine synthase (glutamine-hydrolysing)
VSGIVGMINLDGSPIDRHLLEQMTAFLAFRGPDAQATWVDGSVGFGHALLRTTVESEREQQPSTLDGQVWITADARIDDRANLIKRLAGHGREATMDVPDVELILHAYHAWDENCVEHLLGDFAFAIWDGRQRRLFGARDHFGVKPFFYAMAGNCLVFGNTLNCVRLHPAVSDRLNERSIGDFLVFGRNLDPAISAFADVQRLPAAHVLTGSSEGVRLHRYWRLPTDGDIRYRLEAEYVEHYKDLLRRAVEDRLRADRVAIFMSGGLDSSAVATTARKLTPGGSGLDLRAFTIVYDELIPDEERHFTGIVGRALNIPVTYLVADGYRLFERQDQEELNAPEPLDDPVSVAFMADLYRQIIAHARVALTGEGGDPAFLGSAVYALSLLKAGRLGRLAVDMWRCLARGRLPLVGFRARLRRWLGKTWAYPYPTWLNKGFEAALGLRVRWQEVNARVPRVHPRRPEAYGSLTESFWPHLVFEAYDPAVTRCPFEVRHPFFDVRLLTYVLAIPALPWCYNKELHRCALAGLVPETIRLRPKTPVLGDPFGARICREDCGWLDRFESCPGLDRFVDRERLPRLAGETDTGRFLLNTRPYSLNNWLRRVAGSRHRLHRDHGRPDEPRSESGCAVSV